MKTIAAIIVCTAISLSAQVWTLGSAEDPCVGGGFMADPPVRYGAAFTCSVPVTSGLYIVRLDFFEPTSVRAGERLIDVYVNDQLFLRKFDPFANGASKTRKISRSIVVAVDTPSIVVRVDKGESVSGRLSAISAQRYSGMSAEAVYDWGPLGHVFQVAESPWTDYRDRCTITLMAASNPLGIHVAGGDDCHLLEGMDVAGAYQYLVANFPALHLEAPNAAMQARCRANVADAPYVCADYPYIPIGCENYPDWALMVCHT